MVAMLLSSFAIITINVVSHVTIRFVTGRFTINCPLWPCTYLAPLWRYSTSKIMGSRPWPFGVTWCYRSRNRLTRCGRLPMGGPLWPGIYLALLWRYEASNVGCTDECTHERMNTQVILYSVQLC